MKTAFGSEGEGSMTRMGCARFGTYDFGLKEEADEKKAGSTEDERRRFRLRKDVAQLTCDKSSGALEDADTSDIVSGDRSTKIKKKRTRKRKEEKRSDRRSTVECKYYEGTLEKRAVWDIP